MGSSLRRYFFRGTILLDQETRSKVQALEERAHIIGRVSAGSATNPTAAASIFEAVQAPAIRTEATSTIRTWVAGAPSGTSSAQCIDEGCAKLASSNSAEARHSACGTGAQLSVAHAEEVSHWSLPFRVAAPIPIRRARTLLRPVRTSAFQLLHSSSYLTFSRPHPQSRLLASGITAS